MISCFASIIGLARGAGFRTGKNYVHFNVSLLEPELRGACEYISNTFLVTAKIIFDHSGCHKANRVGAHTLTHLTKGDTANADAFLEDSLAPEARWEAFHSRRCGCGGRGGGF